MAFYAYWLIQLDFTRREFPVVQLFQGLLPFPLEFLFGQFQSSLSVLRLIQHDLFLKQAVFLPSSQDGLLILGTTLRFFGPFISRLRAAITLDLQLAQPLHVEPSPP